MKLVDLLDLSKFVDRLQSNNSFHSYFVRYITSVAEKVYRGSSFVL
jgi:hypothetical protein